MPVGNLTLNVLCNATNPQLDFTEANPGAGIMAWNYDVGPTTEGIGDAGGTGTDTLGLGSLPPAGEVITFGNASGPVAGTFNYRSGDTIDTITVSAFAWPAGNECQILGTGSVTDGASFGS